MLSFFPRGILDEILNLIESVSDGLPTYFKSIQKKLQHLLMNFVIVGVSESTLSVML